MTITERKEAEILVEKHKPADRYSKEISSDGIHGLSCHYPDISKTFWRLDDVLYWVDRMMYPC